jgi:hypothetical protein
MFNLARMLSLYLAQVALLFSFSAFHACSRPVQTPVPILVQHAGIYYLDCSASQNGNGTQSSPWNSLSTANAFVFHPGDRFLLKRGTTCNGALMPRGSGIPNEPIVIDAYGTGAQPIVSGGDTEEAFKLFNQEYWEINNLEITGGNRYGIYISGNTPNSRLNHFYLRKLNVHSATYNSSKRADSGEVFISPEAVGETLNDVLVEGVMAHDSHVSEGIFVSAGGAWIEGNGVSQPLGSNVTVQNSTAHDVYGDGILISELHNGLLQRNVVYRTGLCPNCTGSTPVGLWEWYCHTCTVQYNESYANQSWAEDGGDFDIDYFNDDNVVQYNYGHDSAGYCVAIFGAGGRASHRNIFRYNICSNNGRRSELSKQGEIYLHTWDQGSLDGIEIYNNTISWNPASNAAAFTTSDAVYSGDSPRFFKNNIIYATVPIMVQITSAFILDHNIYWTTSTSPASWQVDGKTYRDFKEYQFATQLDTHSYKVNPMLNNPGYHAVGMPTSAFQLLPNSPAMRSGTDVCAAIRGCCMGIQNFWGSTLTAGQPYHIGAY